LPKQERGEPRTTLLRPFLSGALCY
jgi:hypothetical protein